jgi:large subunit ribosomal protein L25
MGEIPGILYGHKEEPTMLTVSEHELWHILHNATSEHLILRLEIEGAGSDDVVTLVRDVQHHPVTGDILHIDFQRISLDEKIKVGVPVALIGQATGVKEFGGILDHGVREVTVHCKPAEIPESLEVDVTGMEIGHSIHISDIMPLYPNLEFMDDPNVTLAHVSPPKKIEVTREEIEEEAEVVSEEVEAEAPAEGDSAGEGEEK